MNVDELTEDEKKILKIVAEKEQWTEYTYERKSDREYDISIEGKQKSTIGGSDYMFSAWLRLSIIRAVDWTQNKIWKYSDGYGQAGYLPVQKYDWSGIRDSSDVAIGKMMRVAIKELLKPTKPTKTKKVTKKVTGENIEGKKKEWAERWATRVHSKG